ncbi:VIT family domain containing protein [Naviculisporaceae sp. PSN 640]
MSLNTLLRSVGLGQRRRSMSSSGSSEGSRKRSSSADRYVLPAYNSPDHIHSTVEHANPQAHSSLPRNESRTTLFDSEKDNEITATIDEIGAEDIGTAGGHFSYDPYTRPQTRRTDYSQSQRRRESSEDDGSNDSDGGNTPSHSLEPSTATTKGSLLRPFLANFTIGFADGLTAPFAVTAGLSFLGSSRLVITAGGIELIAGCGSMGVGGYLSGRGERNAAAREAARESAKKERGQSTSPRHSRPGSELEFKPDAPETAVQMSPVASGSSISLGYLVGGIIPLLPYIFVSEVRNGLTWSFGVCVAALFLFGSIKEFVLCVEHFGHDSEEDDDYEDYYNIPFSPGAPGSSGMFYGFVNWTRRARSVPAEEIRNCVWEGLVMAALGSAAAVATVLCVVASQVVFKDKEATGDKSA